MSAVNVSGKAHFNQMNTRRFLVIALLLPGTALAASVTGRLVGGGGTDDMRIVVQPAAGKAIEAYCTTHCGDWFEADGQSEVSTLKKSVKGKNLVLEYAVEPNHDRIAGPDSKERLFFVKKIRFLP